MHFIYPRSMLERNLPDELFQEEARQIAAAGHWVSLIDTESLTSGSPHVTPRLTPATYVVYRGWMLTSVEYTRLIQCILTQQASPLTTVEQYLEAHYLANWYHVLSDLTPETIFLNPDDDLVGSLIRLGWKRFFVKDYVKSLKTSVGSIIERPEDIEFLVSEMVKYRGTIEGGLCIRRVETFKPNSEERYFVLNGVGYRANQAGPIPSIVKECALRISSPFFTVDVARRIDGVDRVVEIGDGQVSDLVGWTVASFVNIWVQSHLLN